jgi:hypothetical protein
MSTPVRRRMRSSSVALGITAVMAANLSGCASSSPDYAAVCVNPDTQERVDDDQCDEDSDYNGSGAGFFWYYLAARSIVPGVGSTVTGGTYRGSTLNGTVQRGGLPTTGGSTVRSSTTKGGFGGSNRSFGG